MQKPKQRQTRKRNQKAVSSSAKNRIKKNSGVSGFHQQPESVLHQQGLTILQQGAPLKQVFKFLADQLETLIPNSRVLLGYPDTITTRLTISTGLPTRLTRQVRDLKKTVFQNTFYGEGFSGRGVASIDLQSHPAWKVLGKSLSSNDCRFCHTIPIKDTKDVIVGTISLFTNSKRPPTKSQLSIVASAAQIAGIAIQRQCQNQAIKKLKARLGNEVEEPSQNIREAIRQLQDEIVQRKIMERSLKTSNEKLQNLSNHLENVREEERTRISREIHDELGQMLTTLKMKLAILEERSLDEGFPIQDDIQIMMRLVETTLETVRRISTELRPGILDVLGLSEALEWQAQEFQEQTKIKMRCDIQALPENLGKDISTACFRICQEALTNVARHAKASRVTICLRHSQGKLELIVRDNGKGITNEQLSRLTSLGLIGMRERAQNLGGDLNIERAEEKGTEVSFSFPLELAP